MLNGSLASSKQPDGGEPEEHGDEENEAESQRGLQDHLPSSEMGPGHSIIISANTYGRQRPTGGQISHFYRPTLFLTP